VLSGVIHDDKGAEVGHYKFTGKYGRVPIPKPPKGPRKNARKPPPPTARERKIAEIIELLAAADIEPVANNRGINRTMPKSNAQPILPLFTERRVVSSR
jgi:hypothetical protein